MYLRAFSEYVYLPDGLALYADESRIEYKNTHVQITANIVPLNTELREVLMRVIIEVLLQVLLFLLLSKNEATTYQTLLAVHA